MILFPFFQDIEDKTFVVIGGGQVASGKVKHLLKFTRRIIVIAPETEIEAKDGILVLHREYQPGDIQRGDYIIGATGDRKINAKIAAEAKAAGKPVNIVDDAELCTFIFPSLIKKGDLTVGITSNGKSPSATQYVRKQMEDAIPENMEVIIDRMGRLRHVVPQYILDGKVRAQVYREILDVLLKTENRASDDVIASIIRSHARNQEIDI